MVKQKIREPLRHPAELPSIGRKRSIFSYFFKIVKNAIPAEIINNVPGSGKTIWAGTHAPEPIFPKASDAGKQRQQRIITIRFMLSFSDKKDYSISGYPASKKFRRY